MVGLSLIILEIIFIPGTTVAGIIGFLFLIYGNYLSFEKGALEGGLVLTATLLFTVVMTIYAFKNKSWEKFSLKNESASKVNEDLGLNLKVGDEGKTVSALRPYGKAMFFESDYEVKTMGDFAEAGTKVKIKKIDNKNIFVIPLKDK